ncbi:MAG: hypothetical protein ACRBDL_03450 [Alphaproteobacteria bacterium]
MTSASLTGLIGQIEAVKKANIMQKPALAEKAIEAVVGILIEQNAEISRLTKIIEGDS